MPIVFTHTKLSSILDTKQFQPNPPQYFARYTWHVFKGKAVTREESSEISCLLMLGTDDTSKSVRNVNFPHNEKVLLN